MTDFLGLSMIGTYEQRKVANTVVGETVIDTCAVTDSTCGFETGIQSPLYNGGLWVIVEEYDSKADAKRGHARWVKKMAKPPATLTDTSSCSIKRLLNAFGRQSTFKRKGGKKKAKK